MKPPLQHVLVRRLALLAATVLLIAAVAFGLIRAG